MKIVSFKLKGKMAHFRKIYSNSSSLSYFIPPRTTMMGIIAGLLGYERDTYYEEFNRRNCRIAIGVNAPMKKSMQTLNYLKVEKYREFNGSNGYHSQTHKELVIPENIREGFLEYQVWFNHEDYKILEKLEDNIKKFHPTYQSQGISLGLGTAYNLGWIEYVDTFEGDEKLSEEIVQINSVIPLKDIEDILIEQMDGKCKLIKEEVPLEFNSEREITKESLREMIVDSNGGAIWAKVNSYVELENNTKIMWMK